MIDMRIEVCITDRIVVTHMRDDGRRITQYASADLSSRSYDTMRDVIRDMKKSDTDKETC